MDILQDLSAEDSLVLRRAFQRRHAHVNRNGMIGGRYVRKVPEDSGLLGRRAELSLDEFEQAASVLRVVVDRVAALPRL